MSDTVTMEKIVELAKQRGFIFPGSEIYGGLANSWDYGPMGVLLKMNIKQAWWKKFVESRLDIVGVDTALIMNTKVWEASGHLETFNDPLVECKNCHARFRADHIDTSWPCQNCGTKDSFTDPASFNLMFKTFIGPKEEAAGTVYLRPETAQGMFVDFDRVQMSSRKRIPFGIAQIGKAFRNEITPGNFIFRTREFEQMEIEYFVHPNAWEEHFEKWLVSMHEWLEWCGIDKNMTHNKEIEGEELAHYSKRTVDIEFDWPFGRDELYGLAYRGDHDLVSHSQHSGKEIVYTDPETTEKYVPHVVEPTFGVDRTLLAMLISAYKEEKVGDEMRTVLKLPKWAAPYKVAILPLSKKSELTDLAAKIFGEFSDKVPTDFDVTQSIGKRYRRQDEVGTPYCVTIDFDSLNDKKVTVRDRDSMEQERVTIDSVVTWVQDRLS